MRHRNILRLVLFCFVMVVLACLIGCHRATNIAGEVFVATRGAGNYKLGATKVWAYPSEVFKGHLDSKRSNMAKLSHDLKKKAESCAGYALTYTAQLNEDLCQSEAAKLRIDISEEFIKGMPVPVAGGTTDSDGKFKMTLESRGAYTLVAVASRAVGRSYEEYVWIVPVIASGDEQTISLSNGNLWDFESPLP